jgi:hypothetical protein
MIFVSCSDCVCRKSCPSMTNNERTFRSWRDPLTGERLFSNFVVAERIDSQVVCVPMPDAAVLTGRARIKLDSARVHGFPFIASPPHVLEGILAERR